MHIENGKLAYEAITGMECKPWTLTEVYTLTNSDRLLSLIILEEIKTNHHCTYVFSDCGKPIKCISI